MLRELFIGVLHIRAVLLIIPGKIAFTMEYIFSKAALAALLKIYSVAYVFLSKLSICPKRPFETSVADSAIGSLLRSH